MKIQSNWLARCLVIASVLSTMVHAEDIDIFTGTTNVNTSLPNVIFVLDNTSNWSRESQKWPDGTQGESEVRAIKAALQDKIGELNVGIMEYQTASNNANNDGAYVRFDLQELTQARFDALDDVLTKIEGNIGGPKEKRDSSNLYGYLPYDFYNYLSGAQQSKRGVGTPATEAGPPRYPYADTDAYASNYDTFSSPLGAVDACADTYMIFIGNNTNGSIAGDDSANSDALKQAYADAGAEAPDALAGESGTPLAMPAFASKFVQEDDTVIPAYTIPGYTIPGYTIEEEVIPASDLGISGACYKGNNSGKTACTNAENSAGGLCVGQKNCYCSVTVTPKCGSDYYYKVHTDGWTIAGEVVPEQVVDPVFVPEQIIPGGLVEVFYASGGKDTTTGLNYNFDDWAQFLHNYGIPLTVTVEGETYSERVKVTTYTIDVFNKQQSPELSSVWFSAAEAGGGRYFQARNENQLKVAINSAVGDILAVGSSFAAVSLPLSATNRARVDNQLYIGMFRPSLGKEPRWFGNLKRYQLALFNGVPGVADVNLYEAINSNSGRARPCAESFWSADSGNYWESLGISPPLLSDCRDVDVTNSPWSDLPDGAFVEKGGAGQQLREGPAGNARTIYTVADDTNLRLLADEPGLRGATTGTVVLDYLRGDAAGSDGEVMPAAGLRASVHGDVVHSRPLAVRHSPNDVTLYYGGNDGPFRAVDGADGTERWSLVVPEHFGKIERLYNNTQLVLFTGAVEAGAKKKDYFFDGPTGEITRYDDTGVLELAYIYPTMRRGGRMIYALDVTGLSGPGSDPDPDVAPDLLWRVGCPKPASDPDQSGCTTGFESMGQTWSMPVGGYVAKPVDGNGDPQDPQLVVAFGGGFDDCLNADVAAYPISCSTAKGKGVYILDATTGERLALLDTDAPVITDVAPIDINFDGYLDFAYVADVAGSLYRINFAMMNSSNPDGGLTALAKGDWTIDKIASSSNTERRFYNTPVAAAFQGIVIITWGSGDRERPLEINYPFTTPVQNRFYAFYDEPYKTFVANPVGALDVLDEATTVDLDGSSMLAVVAVPDDDAGPIQEYDGWYMDLTDRGEQVANPAAIGGGRVFFNTFQPGGTSEGLCSRPLGIGTGYDVNLFGPEFTTGEVITGAGFPIPPVLVTSVLPTGLADCDGPDCPTPTGGDGVCANPPCKVITFCIGCQGLDDVIEIVPNAPPKRRRIFFTEDIDRSE